MDIEITAEMAIATLKRRVGDDAVFIGALQQRIETLEIELTTLRADPPA